MWGHDTKRPHLVNGRQAATVAARAVACPVIPTAPPVLMSQFLRPGIRAMAAYTPGEQPRDEVFVKLNTNENPYPPSPRVLAALTDAGVGERLRKYPDPLGTAFRQAAGRVLGVDPEGILIGNGSDDVLTILTRAF